MNETVLQIIGLILGGGILVTILRISFQIGKYTNRLEVLERAFGELRQGVATYNVKVDAIDKNVGILLDRQTYIKPQELIRTGH